MPKRLLSLLLLLHLFAAAITAQTAKDEIKMAENLRQYFAKYKPKGMRLTQQPRLLSYQLNNSDKTLVIHADEFFAAQEFTPEITTNIYKKVLSALPKVFQSYQVTIVVNGMTIDELIPNRLSKHADQTRMWGDIDYEGAPWTYNISQPIHPTQGLQGRHIALWASHGRYFDQKRGYWRWQRPGLFGTTEDLYTQTIVVPYLIPMLENAGAVVYTPRERDWQKDEYIVDNDYPQQNYIERADHGYWQTTELPGFAFHSGTYTDGENPFEAGTARMTKTTASKSRMSKIIYQPTFRKAGRYAVYVSYQTLPESVDDALYSVWHHGECTQLKVNQRMGGSTWVYLGTYYFDAGYSAFNCVTISNYSSKKGIVTTDAVRFGGGMGNIERHGEISQLPRALEGARYATQWAGMPYHVYSSKNGQDDYADDINARSLSVNLLGGGSCFMPNTEGRKVPFELSLAIHSDAGYDRSGEGLIGSLSICTTKFNEGKLCAGISRMASRDLADAILSGVNRDIKYKYGQWNRRELFDRNYSETRLPAIPSVILETLSHQNFPDMRYGQDPHFQFTLARSVYKTLLRYINDQHEKPFTVAPLTPEHFRMEFSGHNEIRLSWDAVNDPQEPTAIPTGYILYTAVGNSDFDNGTYIRSKTSYEIKLEPGILYHFRVRAVNKGGTSFPSEVLSACYQPQATETVLIVNGFHRLSSPAVRNTAEEQGFDLDEDPGITYGPTLGWAGRQTNFDRSQMGIEYSGLGATGNELEGMLIAGNDFNYVMTHAEAIASAKRYNILSCSGKALEAAKVKLHSFAAVDLLLGLERNDGHSLEFYKTFSTSMQHLLQNYTSQGGALMVSGAYIGRDMATDSEKKFLADILKCQWSGVYRGQSNLIRGLGTETCYWNKLNEDHYAATSADILQPVKPAYTVMQYADGYTAAIGYKGNDYRIFAMGFPFECIQDAQKRASMMRGILNYLLK